MLTRSGINGFIVEKHAARFVIRGLVDTTVPTRLCSRVFGVAYAARAVLVQPSMGAVMQTIVQLADEALLPGQSFAIRSHRSTRSALSRREIEVQGGSEVLSALKNKGVKVNLKRPDTTIFVDILDDRVYVYRDRVQGPGGLPLSSQWKMLAVLDSGWFTVLSAYAMMRRACLVELFIPVSDVSPFFARENQIAMARKLRGLFPRMTYRAFLFDFDNAVQREIGGQPLGYDEAKRLARIAGLRFAREKRFRGVILSNVSGHIGPEIRPYDTDGQLPIFQPLIGLETEDLIEMCKQIGISDEELFSQGWVSTSPRAGQERVNISEKPTESLVQQIVL